MFTWNSARSAGGYRQRWQASVSLYGKASLASPSSAERPRQSLFDKITSESVVASPTPTAYGSAVIHYSRLWSNKWAIKRQLTASGFRYPQTSATGEGPTNLQPGLVPCPALPYNALPGPAWSCQDSF